MYLQDLEKTTMMFEYQVSETYILLRCQAPPWVAKKSGPRKESMQAMDSGFNIGRNIHGNFMDFFDFREGTKNNEQISWICFSGEF